MKKTARLPDEDRVELFRNTAARLGLNEAIVEKDFWVCFTLDYLFHTSSWKDSITFKGGTSLSKGYDLISRFSEDIDLILDWRVLGYDKNEPLQKRSNRKQDRFNKEANLRAEEFLREILCPDIKDGLSAEIGSPASVYIDKDNPHTIIFAYPRLLNSASTLQVIRLEIGPLAAWTPSESVSIKSYAADCYPRLFHQPETVVRTVKPVRTFWEKATILHHEAHRPEGSNMPLRYSRHYYDLYKMSRSWVKQSALKDPALLSAIVSFKMQFYPRPWAHYEKAVPGTLKHVPPDYRLPELVRDYGAMKDMLYGDVPDFKVIISALSELEKEINTMANSDSK